MDKIILRDETGYEYYSVELNNSGWIYSRWAGEITEEKIKQGGVTLVSFASESAFPYVINDNRELAGSWLSSVDWIEEELTPKLIEAGVKFIAHILSPDFITKFSAVELEARDLDFQFKLCSDLDEAEEWIKLKMNS